MRPVIDSNNQRGITEPYVLRFDCKVSADILYRALLSIPMKWSHSNKNMPNGNKATDIDRNRASSRLTCICLSGISFRKCIPLMTNHIKIPTKWNSYPTGDIYSRISETLMGIILKCLTRYRV